MNRKLCLLGVLALGALTGNFAQAHRASTCDAAPTAATANDLLGKVAADYATKDWGQLNVDAAKLTPMKGLLDPDDQVIFDVIMDSETFVPGATDAKLGTTTPPPVVTTPTVTTPTTPPPGSGTPKPSTPTVVTPAVVVPAAEVVPPTVTVGDKVAMALCTRVGIDLAAKNRVGGETDAKHLGRLINNSKLSKPVRAFVVANLKTANEWLNFPKNLLAKAQSELANKKWAAAEADIATLKSMTDLTPAQKAELAKEEEFLAKHKK